MSGHLSVSRFGGENGRMSPEEVKDRKGLHFGVWY
jgi:hypothetical protein